MSEGQISITLPDGSQRKYSKNITGLEIAQSISSGLAREAVSITVNGEIFDLDRPITDNASISINTWKDEDGPPIENGFYYDIDFGETKIATEDLEKIEDKFIEKARQKNSFERKAVSKKEALEHYKIVGNKYKIDLIKGLEDGEITFYTQGDFTDLCRGPHVPNTGVVKAVKLTSIAGAYWRGDSNSKQLTRIYGISFPKQKLLEEYLHQIEEAKKRDHRKLGKQLGIYMIDEMVGSGLPMWLPNGALLRRSLETFLREEQKKRGYQEVITPHIGSLKLYRTSGHYPYYQDSQYNPIQVDDEEYMLKPMNCPHHHRIYSSSLKSYRDLPVRLAEFGTVYRYEQSGELSGLSRVRGFTQDDAHIYCTHDQLKQEIKNTIELTQFVFSTFGMPVDIRLSYRDDNEDKYGGNSEYWERAQKEIREVADEMSLDYKIAPGEASFYGPKIDFIIRDTIGRKWQLGTVQVDYVMPERFDLTYVGSDNEKHRPVIIHRAPFGSMERFTSILIEHFAGDFPLWLAPEQTRIIPNFAGDFPLWLAPEQTRIIPISENHNEFAHKLANRLKKEKIRAEVDTKSEQIGSKIRDAETSKIPYMLIVGDKELENDTVSVRRHKEGDIGTFKISDLISRLTQEINSKSLPNIN